MSCDSGEIHYGGRLCLSWTLQDWNVSGSCTEAGLQMLELVQEQSGEVHQQPSGDMIPPGVTAFKQGRLSFLSENNHRVLSIILSELWMMLLSTALSWWGRALPRIVSLSQSPSRYTLSTAFLGSILTSPVGPCPVGNEKGVLGLNWWENSSAKWLVLLRAPVVPGRHWRGDMIWTRSGSI